MEMVTVPVVNVERPDIRLLPIRARRMLSRPIPTLRMARRVDLAHVRHHRSKDLGRGSH